jgi:aryl-alcohol dehydrogenase-like predicted oxidoreductase
LLPARFPDDLLIATKIGARSAPDTNGSGRRLGLSRPAVREQVEGSLRRLGLDRVGLLYAHIDDRSVPLVGTLGAFDELVQEGLVGAVACSNYTRDRLAEALTTSRQHGLAAYQVIQMRTSYLTPSSDADFGIQEPWTTCCGSSRTRTRCSWRRTRPC